MERNDTDSTTSDTARRTGADGPKTRLLLTANRWTVVGVLSAGVFVSLVLAGTFGPASVRRVLAYQDPIDTVFQGLVGGIITGVTLVLTINQLVLSQELGPIGDQRDRMEGALSFRQDVEDATELVVSPTRPAAFLRALVEATRRRANALEAALTAGTDRAAREEIIDYVNDVTDDAEEVTGRLDESRFGTFDVVNAVLNYSYSRKIHDGRRIRNAYGDALPDEVSEALDDLVEVVGFFAPAREHIKTLYFQWELINLSYAILFSAVPALVVAFVTILFFTPASVPGATLGVDNALLIVSAAVTVAVIPFVTLLAYILRIASVAKRTLAIGPFVLTETDRDEEIEWER